MAVRKPTAKQQRFVNEYLIDLNATQAAIRAGYSPRRASELGYQLLQNPTVTAALQAAQKKQAARTAVTADKVVLELAKIAFSDASDLAEVVTVTDKDPVTGEPDTHQTVRIKETKQLTDDQRATLAQIKQGKNGIEVSRYDKMRALELLGRHLGMFDQREAPEEDAPDDGFLDALRGEAADLWQK